MVLKVKTRHVGPDMECASCADVCKSIVASNAGEALSEVGGPF